MPQLDASACCSRGPRARTGCNGPNACIFHLPRLHQKKEDKQHAHVRRPRGATPVYLSSHPIIFRRNHRMHRTAPTPSRRQDRGPTTCTYTEYNPKGSVCPVSRGRTEMGAVAILLRSMPCTPICPRALPTPTAPFHWHLTYSRAPPYLHHYHNYSSAPRGAASKILLTGLGTLPVRRERWCTHNWTRRAPITCDRP